MTVTYTAVAMVKFERNMLKEDRKNDLLVTSKTFLNISVYASISGSCDVTHDASTFQRTSSHSLIYFAKNLAKTLLESTPACIA